MGLAVAGLWGGAAYHGARQERNKARQEVSNLVEKYHVNDPAGAVIVRLPDGAHQTKNLEDLSATYSLRERFGCRVAVFDGNVSFQICREDIPSDGFSMDYTEIHWKDSVGRNIDRAFLEFKDGDRKDRAYSDVFLHEDRLIGTDYALMSSQIPFTETFYEDKIIDASAFDENGKIISPEWIMKRNSN